MLKRIEEELRKRKETNLLRRLDHPIDTQREGRVYIKGKEYINFSSNDYLGLASHPKLKEAGEKAIEEMGTSASASRLLSGDLRLYHCLEEEIARLKGKESALIFNSGYQANIGVISALCTKEDAVFSDRLNHASIVDGILLSGARLFRFRHNDLAHLNWLLEKERRKYRNALIISESVFSMEGDFSPLRELVELKEKYACQMMIDEAHATGVFGEEGEGRVEKEDLAERIEVVMGTFGKALGGFGAYIACSKRMREYLVNFARSFIYSTALPPAVVAGNLVSLELIREEGFRRKELLEKAEYLRKGLKEKGVCVRGCSQIIPIIVSDSEKAVELSKRLWERGYWTFPIREPTVPPKEARLRISLTYAHKQEVLERFIEDVCELIV